jgi:hypothetical protein
MATKNCRWVIKPYTPDSPAVYCEKSVKWTMTEDGGERGASRVRKYSTFCTEHQAIIDAEEEEEA